ncbi:MAG: MFS transporter [Ferruginibacter sp.]
MNSNDSCETLSQFAFRKCHSTSIGSALLTWILGLFHYVPKSGTAQTESAIHGTKLLVSIFPSIPFLLGVGLLFFYEINKKMEVQIESDLKQRRSK